MWHAKGGVLLGLQVQLGFGPPSFLLTEGGKREGEGDGKGKGGARPLPLVQFGLPMGGGAPPLVGCPLSPLWPMLAHYFPPGVTETPRYPRNHSGVQILSSNISIFTS